MPRWNLTALFAAAALVGGAAPQNVKTVPDFSSLGTAWLGPGAGDIDFIPVPGSPPLVRNAPAHPYISNASPVSPANSRPITSRTSQIPI